MTAPYALKIVGDSMAPIYRDGKRDRGLASRPPCARTTGSWFKTTDGQITVRGIQAAAPPKVIELHALTKGQKKDETAGGLATVIWIGAQSSGPSQG